MIPTDVVSAEDASRRLKFMDKEDSTRWSASDRELYVYANAVEYLWKQIDVVRSLHSGEHYCQMSLGPKLGQKYAEGEVCPTAQALYPEATVVSRAAALGVSVPVFMGIGEVRP